LKKVGAFSSVSRNNPFYRPSLSLEVNIKINVIENQGQVLLKYKRNTKIRSGEVVWLLHFLARNKVKTLCMWGTLDPNLLSSLMLGSKPPLPTIIRVDTENPT
jgi:hypothetical protein